MKRRHPVRRMLCVLLILMVCTVMSVGIFYGVKGYQMYQDAISLMPLNDRIEEIQEQEHFTRYSEMTDFYINAAGGKELYRADEFLQNGITLKFIKMNSIEYPQFGGEFVPNLSIVDVLMFNDKETVKKMLREYTLED